MELFWARTKRAENGCLLWDGPKYRNGYGQYTFYIPETRTRVKALAHRIAFVNAVRPLEPREKVDHQCHNDAALAGECEGGWGCLHRLCIEPAHLVGRTQRDNLLLGNTLAAKYAARDACHAGHKYTSQNTRMYKGARQCRACGRIKQAEIRLRKKLAKLSAH